MSILLLLSWVLIGTGVLLVAVLLVPVILHLHVSNASGFAIRLEAQILGSWGPRVRLTRGPKTGAARMQRHSARQRRVPALRARRLAAALPRLVADILGGIRLASLHVDCEYGFADPADTGQLAGVLMPVSHAVPLPPNIDLSLRPNFARPCLEGELRAAIRMTALGTLVLPALRFAWHVFGPAR